MAPQKIGTTLFIHCEIIEYAHYFAHFNNLIKRENHFTLQIKKITQTKKQ